MENIYYYMLGSFILFIIVFYNYIKTPESKTIHNFKIEDVKELLLKQEESNNRINNLIFQISKYIKNNNNKKLRLDTLNKHSLFQKDYQTSRLLIDNYFDEESAPGTYDFTKEIPKIKNVIGFKYISSTMNLNLFHPNDSKTDLGLGDYLSTTPIKTFYIDLIIDEIPYIACKKSASEKNIIERIPIQFSSGRDINYHSPIIQKDIYFYPIDLSEVNIKFKYVYDGDIKDVWLFRDISIEFEVTYLLNETNCGLSSSN